MALICRSIGLLILFALVGCESHKTGESQGHNRVQVIAIGPSIDSEMTEKEAEEVIKTQLEAIYPQWEGRHVLLVAPNGKNVSQRLLKLYKRLERIWPKTNFQLWKRAELENLGQCPLDVKRTELGFEYKVPRFLLIQDPQCVRWGKTDQILFITDKKSPFEMALSQLTTNSSQIKTMREWQDFRISIPPIRGILYVGEDYTIAFEDFLALETMIERQWAQDDVGEEKVFTSKRIEEFSNAQEMDIQSQFIKVVFNEESFSPEDLGEIDEMKYNLEVPVPDFKFQIKK